MTFVLVLKLNFADRLADIQQHANQRYAAIQPTTTMDADLDTVRAAIFNRIKDIKVDHFACAMRLGSLQSRPDIVDDNEGCCPICHNSYTDLSTNTPTDLQYDFPIRIKYCGHVIGKGCLEQWMSTPKIDEAKYPHRTCPMCRTKIEGVTPPEHLEVLLIHLKMDRRAMETYRQLLEDWDVEMPECVEAVVACMSDEIACEELLVLVEKARKEKGLSFEADEKRLRDRLDVLKKERRAWGFRGDALWKRMRDEWMRSAARPKQS